MPGTPLYVTETADIGGRSEHQRIVFEAAMDALERYPRLRGVAWFAPNTKDMPNRWCTPDWCVDLFNDEGKLTQAGKDWLHIVRLDTPRNAGGGWT